MIELDADKNWIVWPANPKKFDHYLAIEKENKIIWSNGKNLDKLNVGDILLMYDTSPKKTIQTLLKITRKINPIDLEKNDINEITRINEKYGKNSYCSEFDKLKWSDLIETEFYLKLSKPIKPEEIYLKTPIQGMGFVKEEGIKNLNNLIKKENIFNNGLNEESYYCLTKNFKRDKNLVKKINNRSNGRCEYCNNKTFIKPDGKYYLEIHHIKFLSEGGKDEINNLIGLCSNCHAEAHYSDKIRSNFLKKSFFEKIKQINK